MKRMLIVFVLIASAMLSEVSAQSRLWALVMSKGTGYTQQAWRTRTYFPEQEIKDLWAEGYQITSLTYAEMRWALVVSKGTGYTQQRWFTGETFPADDIKKGWDEGYSITHTTYGNKRWVVVMSKGSNIALQAWRTRTYFPEAEIKELKDKGYYITNLTYGNGLWALVMSTGVGYSEQYWTTKSSFPDTEIKDYWDKGYYITSVEYGNDVWALVMTKGTKHTHQAWRTRYNYPDKEIKELWDNGSYITHLGSSFDYQTLYAGVTERKVDYPVIKTPHALNKINSVTVTPSYTIVTLSYIGTGNSCINTKTYLQDTKTQTKYNLLWATGIPFCETSFTKASKDYTLYFQRIDNATNEFNLVEPEGENPFSFYGIAMTGGSAPSTNPVAQVTTKAEPVGLPPILSIEDITFSENTIDAEETAQLKVTLKNIGPGDAKDVYLNLETNLPQISFGTKNVFPTIAANGGIQTITVNLKASLELPSSMALIRLEVVEPNFKVKIQGKQLSVPTREFRKPELLLAKYAVIENQSASPNNQIDLNEMVDLQFAVQNVGQGDAENVSVLVENNQKGVMFLGVVKGQQLVREHPVYSTIASGKYETVTYRYFVNSEFSDPELKFSIKANERVGRFGFATPKTFAINTKLEETGFIRNIAVAEQVNPGKVVIEDIPDFVVDVDTNIPTTSETRSNVYALIIGNEDYSSRQMGLSKEQNVDFAVNDANMFALYCEKVLGVPKRQIKVMLNATAAEISQGIAWLNNLASIEGSSAELIFYYSGHGLPHEQTQEAYIVPVDVNGMNLEYGLKLNDVYKRLSEHPVKRISVFLDACFSGGARTQSLVAVKGVKVKPKESPIPANMVVFASSTGTESSAVYRPKRHGYFTYFLLKKLKESQGSVTLDELSSYVSKNVSKEAGLDGKVQNPQVSVNPSLGDTWKSWKVK